MSDQTLYRWLDQQGEAFGAPGLQARWTSSVKDAIGTAYSASSRVWFTCSHGVLNEIYHPTIDSAQVRDMEFLVTDGQTFVHEEKRDLLTAFDTAMWDTSWLLSEGSIMGKLMHTLIGYTERPTELQLVVYIGTQPSIRIPLREVGDFSDNPWQQ